MIRSPWLFGNQALLKNHSDLAGLFGGVNLAGAAVLRLDSSPGRGNRISLRGVQLARPLACERTTRSEMVNASSVAQVTGSRNFPVFRSGRCGKGNEVPIVSRENTLVLRVARVGYRITSRLELMVLAIILVLLSAGCW